MSEREFAIGQQVRITRRETWQGETCTITRRSRRDPQMYFLKEHGWRRNDEIEAVTQTSIGDKMELEEKYLVLKWADIEAALTSQERYVLRSLMRKVDIHRMRQNKPINNYVVINQDEPYFPDVLRLMEGDSDGHTTNP